MIFTNSSLVAYTQISPYKASRTHNIDTITIHCVAAQSSIETLGKLFQTKRASANYGVGSDGRIGMYVEEKDRSWCSSSSLNDNRAVTIEVASDNYPPYAVNAKAYAAMINLVTDICRRNGIKKLVWSTVKNNRVNHLNGCNMTVHRDYEAKACPGDYLYNRMENIAAEVNRRRLTQEEIDMTKDEVMKLIDERMEEKLRTIEDIGDVPDALKSEVRVLLDCGAINGGTSAEEDPDDINMAYDNLRGVIIGKRYTDKQIDSLTDKVAETVAQRLVECIKLAFKEGDA